MFRNGRTGTPTVSARPRWLAAALLLVATACGSDDAGQPAATVAAPPVQTTALPIPPAPPADGRMQCVPYARAYTGIFIRGDAWTWWKSAAGLYSRGNVPEPYSLLVLAQTERLRAGHLSVVVAVPGPREIRVSHANWLNDERIIENIPVIDVSEKNDWSQVRFWNPSTGAYGRIYEAYGFVYRNPGAPDV
jgi:hypothetical protein